MTEPACGFSLFNINETELREENAFYLFEPSLILQIHGRNVFSPFGHTDSGPVVVMDFLEEALSETLGMLAKLEMGDQESEHEYEMSASLWIFTLRRRGMELQVIIDGTSRGDVQAGPQAVGSIKVSDWLTALILLGRDLLSLFQRSNPTVYANLGDIEGRLVQLDAWLARSSTALSD